MRTGQMKEDPPSPTVLDCVTDDVNRNYRYQFKTAYMLSLAKHAEYAVPNEKPDIHLDYLLEILQNTSCENNQNIDSPL